MKFRLFDVDFYISYVFALSITLFIAFDKSRIFLPIAFSVAVHELSHIVAMCCFKAKPKEIKLCMGTVNIINKNILNLHEEIIVLLAGPLANLLIFIISTVFKLHSTLANVNLSLFILNMLCVEGLDGGTIVEIMLKNLMDLNSARKTFLFIKIINLAIFIGFYIICIINNVINYTFLFFIIYLFLKLW